MIMKYSAILVLFTISLFSCAVNGLNSGGSGGGTSGTSGPILLTGVFVATNGSDTNSGTNQFFPLRSFSFAISNALANGLSNIYVAEGVYRPGAGLNSRTNGLVITNSGLHFSGGWDSNFQFQTGFSELDGTNDLDHVVYAKNVFNMAMQGFVVKNGVATGNDTAHTNGAGMYLTNLTGCLFTNITVSSNYSTYEGGGIWFCGVSNRFSLNIVSNSASYSYGYGGGIYVGPGSFYNKFSGDIAYNAGIGGGGMFFDTNSGNNDIACIIEGNIASGMYGGGGIAFYHSHSNTFHGIIRANTTYYVLGPMCYAGGVFVYYSCQNLIEGVICSNSGYSGSGGCVLYGTNNTFNAYFYDNIDAGYGGGLFLYFSANTLISGIVLRNVGIWCCNGGGICFLNSSGILSNIIITENGVGGGVYNSGSTVITNDAYIYNNVPFDY